MAQTTTPVDACDVVVVLDDDGGTPTDISGSTNRVQFNLSQDLGQYHPYGDTWPSRLDGGKDGAITLTVLYTTAASEGADLLLTWFDASSPGARTLRVDIPDSSIGSDRFMGEVRLDALRWTADAGGAGPILMTANLLPDGTLDRSAIAT